MVSHQITKGGTPNFWSSGSTTLPLYHCDESVSKDSLAELLNVPGRDANSAVSIDYLGTTMVFSLTGYATVNDVHEIWKYAHDLAGLQGTYATLISGAQGNTGGGQKGYLFDSMIFSQGQNPSTGAISENSSNTPNTSGSYRFGVYVKSVRINKKVGAISRIDFELTLNVVSTSVSN